MRRDQPKLGFPGYSYHAAPLDMTDALRWLDDKHATINGIKLFASIVEEDYYSFKSTTDEFLVVKDRSMIETELALMDAPKRIVELEFGRAEALFASTNFFLRRSS